MKLNYKRTILVGFAFFLISAFWQAYDTYIPLILNNKFGMSQFGSGVIMALDNIVAVVMLPIFGALSDKCTSRFGRRTPFVLIGTLCAVVALAGLTFTDSVQLKNIEKVSIVDDQTALYDIYDAKSDEKLKDPDGKEFVLAEHFSREEFAALRSTDDEITPAKNSGMSKMSNYTRFVVPARQAYVGDLTTKSPGTLILFIGVLLTLLVSMSSFRSPAVALMPDVTIKPLRSKGNAVINLMGAAGGCLILVIGILLKTGVPGNIMMSYYGVFALVATIMLISLAIFVFTVKEKQWASEMEADTAKFGIDENKSEESDKRKLSKKEFVSLLLLLASVFLWYFGYNAVISKYSVYAGIMLAKDYNLTMIVAQAAAIVSYIPVGIIASKIGRRKTILIGVALLTFAFAAARFMNAETPMLVVNLLFAIAGIAWATINVNSFPMVVELCTGGDVGKYTGYYYTASMAAQAITPMISGWIMDLMGLKTLFTYGAIFAGLAFVTMFFVKHGDVKPVAKQGLEALDVDD